MYPLVFKKYMFFDLNALIFGCIGATFFSMYHIFLSTAYRYSDVSSVYPITTSSPLFIAIWALIFLGEKLSFFGAVGITITILGGILLNKVKGEAFSISKGSIFAFLASFTYSFGALIDKWGVSGGNVILYTYFLCMFMTFYLSIFSYKYKPFRKSFLIAEGRNIALAGVIIFASFTSYRYGLTFMEVSYASALRQVNAVFALGISVLIFKESFSVNKLIGTLIIICGVVLIKLGM